MNATSMRKLAIESANKEIDDIEKRITEASKKSETSIILKDVSGAAIAYFKDNGYEIERNEANLSQERTVIGYVKIIW